MHWELEYSRGGITSHVETIFANEASNSRLWTTNILDSIGVKKSTEARINDLLYINKQASTSLLMIPACGVESWGRYSSWYRYGIVCM